MTIYQITLRDRETRTVLGYYNGAWTTDRHRAIALPKREVAEDHAARMRDLCPRNAELINVEEICRRLALKSEGANASPNTIITRGEVLYVVHIPGGRHTPRSSAARPC